MKKQALLDMLEQKDAIQLKEELIAFIKEDVKEEETHDLQNKEGGIPYKKPQGYVVDFIYLN